MALAPVIDALGEWGYRWAASNLRPEHQQQASSQDGVPGLEKGPPVVPPTKGTVPLRKHPFGVD